MTEFERLFTVHAAYDKRDPEPEKNYGIHGAEMRWVVRKKGEGAVQFLLFTNWQLPEVFGITEEEDPSGLSVMQRYRREFENQSYNSPMPADLGFHSPRPLYEGQSKIADECEILGGPCYYDGSGLNAWAPFEVMLRGGDEALWAYLEDYYRSTFS